MVNEALSFAGQISVFFQGSISRRADVEAAGATLLKHDGFQIKSRLRFSSSVCA